MNTTDFSIQLEEVKQYLLNLQNRMCKTLEQEDGQNQFMQENWAHHSGGGGITCVLENGAVIEKGGVNFSHVHGILPQAATLKRPQLINAPFQAMGVSAVIHPLNPNVPTTHLNVRFLLVEPLEAKAVWWFGGGFDLTPFYPHLEDCVHWHRTAKEACDTIDLSLYPQYKKWCDDYFYLKHRQETRGIGGIFFDDFNQFEFPISFHFMRLVGEGFINAYLPIMQKRKHQPYTEAQRRFQLIRRGRYVEFNLLYDRGTHFGLQSQGRVESILMSLPPQVYWPYQKTVNCDKDQELLNVYLRPRDWLI